MSEKTTCPICEVSICNNEVTFAYGGTGNKARLWARVCKFANRPGCVNDFKAEAKVTESDLFGVVETQEEVLLEMLGDVLPNFPNDDDL